MVGEPGISPSRYAAGNDEYGDRVVKLRETQAQSVPHPERPIFEGLSELHRSLESLEKAIGELGAILVPVISSGSEDADKPPKSLGPSGSSSLYLSLREGVERVYRLGVLVRVITRKVEL